MWAIIPVKRLDQAKQRLAAALSTTERTALATAMLEDVLDALGASAALDGVLLVTRDAAAAELAGRRNIPVLIEADSGERGDAALCAALEQARAHLAARNVHDLLIVPADVPLITPADIEQLLATDTDVALMPDREHQGTNSLLLRRHPQRGAAPPQLPFCFGINSCERHRQLATELGLTVTLLHSARVGLDVDNETDLRLLGSTPGPQRSARLVHELLARRQNGHTAAQRIPG